MFDDRLSINLFLIVLCSSGRSTSGMNPDLKSQIRHFLHLWFANCITNEVGQDYRIASRRSLQQVLIRCLGYKGRNYNDKKREYNCCYDQVVLRLMVCHGWHWSKKEDSSKG